jgi:hypothetical protein
MFLMMYLRFASVILPLDVDSFEKICLVIFLGGKRLLWKPMVHVIHLVYLSLCLFIIFFIYKASAVSNILDLDNFIKMDTLCWNEGKFIESVIRESVLAHLFLWFVFPTCILRLIILWYLSHFMDPHEGGLLCGRGMFSLQCVKWMKKWGKGGYLVALK